MSSPLTHQSGRAASSKHLHHYTSPEARFSMMTSLSHSLSTSLSLSPHTLRFTSLLHTSSHPSSIPLQSSQHLLLHLHSHYFPCSINQPDVLVSRYINSYCTFQCKGIDFHSPSSSWCQPVSLRNKLVPTIICNKFCHTYELLSLPSQPSSCCQQLASFSSSTRYQFTHLP